MQTTFMASMTHSLSLVSPRELGSFDLAVPKLRLSGNWKWTFDVKSHMHFPLEKPVLS